MRLSAVLALSLAASALAVPTDALAQRRPTRAVQNAPAVVPAGTYALDPAHSNFNFSVQHMGLASVTGAFRDVAGTVTVGAAGLSTLRATATAQATSIDTGVEARNNHLRTADFFDVANHPTVTFESTGVTNVRGRFFRLNGRLTMHGVTRPVVLDAEYKGTATQPAQMGGKRLVGFVARTTVNRNDFGLSYGPNVIGRDVAIVLNVEAAQQ